MGRGVTIHFKNNRVSKVTGARSAQEACDASAFAQAFVGAAKVECAEMRAKSESNAAAAKVRDDLEAHEDRDDVHGDVDALT